MAVFNLKVITPEKVFFDAETENVIVRTTVGDIGILARHESYVANIPPGPLKIKIDGKFKVAAVSQGVVKVSRDKTTIIVASAEWADEINIERAKFAEKNARDKLNSKLSDMDFNIADYKLKRALNRISVSQMKDK